MTPTQALELINDTIKGAATQQKLIAFKKIYVYINSDADAKRVRPGYWKGF